MKSICLTGLVIILSLCMVSCAKSSPVMATPTSLPTSQPTLAVDIAQLSTIIPDALLQEGFRKLYEQQTPIPLWDGFAVSGRELAQYILNNAIPVVWGNDTVCGGSCSKLICRDDECTYDDGKPGIDPVYINARIQGQTMGKMTRLMGEMAHEFFHRTQQFGKVTDTRYEEYWAFYLDTQFNRSNGMKFETCQPLDSASLEKWFMANTLNAYLAFESYPHSVQEKMGIAAAQ